MNNETLLGVKRCELEEAVYRDPALHRIFLSVINRMVDPAQRNVFNAVKAGSYSASVFVLQTLAKERGYSTRTELTLKATQPNFSELTEEELEAWLEANGYTRIDDNRAKAPALPKYD